METLSHILLGLQVALTPTNFSYCLLGAFIGTLVGVLPGLGPVTTIAMLLPLTFNMPAVSSLIMLAGIYYGAHHAGSTTAIMLNMPGEPSSVVVCIDGHPMARKGRAGVALFVSAIGSFFAGCVGVLVIATLADPIARGASLLGPAEYTSMMVMALTTAAVLSTKSPVTPMATAALGVLLGCIGTDVFTATPRFTFGAFFLSDGISIVAAATGLFAFSEIARQITAPHSDKPVRFKLRELIPSRADLKSAWPPILRGTGLGALLGIFPGTGPLVASFASYAMERQLAKDPSRFGKGAIEGVAGPEAANNAAAITHFIPMLSLGIPAGPANALMLGALIIAGITPGPQLAVVHPDLFWGVIVSMWLGNLMLLVLNLPLVGIWVKLLTIPYRYLYPPVLVFCCIGIYSVHNQPADLLVAVGFGAVGFVLRKLDCPVGPLILGLVLGPLLEEHARRAMILADGNPMVFVTRPFSLAILLLTVALVVIFARRGGRKAIDAARNAAVAEPKAVIAAQDQQPET